MSRAEVYRIIDVVSDDSASVEPEPEDADEGRRARVGQATARLALWPSPASSESIVAHGEPVPIVDVEQAFLPEQLDARLVMLHAPESQQARSFRLLRHRLLGLGDPRVIAMTSARPREGKTTCAVNLALALAEEAMARVLFIDANLRRPSAGSLFGFEPTQSLVGEMARGSHTSPPYPIVAIRGTRLHVAALPSVPIPEARLDRLLLGTALNDLRDVYDYVIVDASSVLESGDADIVGECAGGVLLAARAGVTRKSDLRHTIDQLRPANVLGTVLVGA